MNNDVLVYGAYGHTGRFVIAELLQRNLQPVLSGRDPAALKHLGHLYPELERRPAAVDDSSALEIATSGVAAVVNCAGPFLDTGLAVATAAARSGAHYLDVTAEQPAAQALYRAHGELGWGTDVAVIPAMAFYGGLPDLLATAAAAEWDSVDEIIVAFGVDRWWPTEGTRITGKRNTARRLVVDDGQLVPVPDQAQFRDWEFRHPLGQQPMVMKPFSEIVTMARHLNASRIHSYLTAVALDDVNNPDTSAPKAVDSAGRSRQRFVVDVVVRLGETERLISASGRDIYAVTAPLVAEAVQRLLDGRAKIQGAAAPAETFDALEFLRALSPRHLQLRGVDNGSP
jgi:short subunit dehydrogenase-like uncharacterized protein